MFRYIDIVKVVNIRKDYRVGTKNIKIFLKMGGRAIMDDFIEIKDAAVLLTPRCGD
jgi:hypothetical protein